MRKPNQSLEDLIFILEDGARISKLAIENYAAFREELAPFEMLPHPSGQGSMATSKVAAERLRRLAERAQKANGLERRVSLKNVKKPLSEELVRRFYRERREPTVREVDKLLSWAAKAAERNCRDQTFYVPIRFIFQQEPGILRLGPVTLMNRETAKAELSNAIRQFVKQNENPERQKSYRRWVREGLSYYRNFRWFAKVTIKGCDSDTAKKAAYKAVSSALDCLHIILSRQHSYRLRMAGPNIRDDRTALISLNADGEMRLTTSVGTLDHVGFVDGWSKDLEREEVAEMFRLAGIALECRADFRP